MHLFCETAKYKYFNAKPKPTLAQMRNDTHATIQQSFNLLPPIYNSYTHTHCKNSQLNEKAFSMTHDWSTRQIVIGQCIYWHIDVQYRNSSIVISQLPTPCVEFFEVPLHGLVAQVTRAQSQLVILNAHTPIHLLVTNQSGVLRNHITTVSNMRLVIYERCLAIRILHVNR